MAFLLFSFLLVIAGHGDDYQVQLAVGQCPKRCIHYVTPSQRAVLEDLLGRYGRINYVGLTLLRAEQITIENHNEPSHFFFFWLPLKSPSMSSSASWAIPTIWARLLCWNLLLLKRHSRTKGIRNPKSDAWFRLNM